MNSKRKFYARLLHDDVFACTPLTTCFGIMSLCPLAKNFRGLAPGCGEGGIIAFELLPSALHPKRSCQFCSIVLDLVIC